MSKPLRILLVEDSEDDALLLLRELKRGGLNPDCRRVDTPEDFDAAIGEGGWQLVITDHNLPRFSSEAVLGKLREQGIDLPVIIVSGSIGEDIAVAAMRTGAHDYIMKDNLARLVPAINRELREAENRQQHRQAEEVIRHLAFHDALTGLTNRHEFEHRLSNAMEASRIDHVAHSLMYIDLDQFKVVNDTCGHTAGDELLKQLSVVLRKPIRDSDVLARLGGDEFGVLLDACPLDRAETLAEDVLQAIRDFRFVWQGKTFTLGASIGLVSITEQQTSISEVLSAADMACYAAKDQGRNRVHVYREGDAELARRHGEMQWVTRINKALEEDRLVLFRQRILPLQSDEARHYEFLLRMRGERGEILPGAFIPAAERYNLMPALDRWVIDNVFRRVTSWLQQGAIDDDSILFVNLSAASLTEPRLLEYIQQKLEEYAVPPGRICFEITETAAIANMKNAIELMTEAKRCGCLFALDDFGSGMSSFSYLKTIPVDIIKIDGEFIRDMDKNPMNAAIVESINKIGQVAGLRTVGEHIEDEETLQRVRDLGLDFGQGYGIEAPGPAWD
jgi:diguanylate cyclase (GGDEF)-like protein